VLPARATKSRDQIGSRKKIWAYYTRSDQNSMKKKNKEHPSSNQRLCTYVPIYVFFGHKDYKLRQEISRKQSNRFDYSPAAGTTRGKYFGYSTTNNSEKIYFDYFVFNIVGCGVNYSLPHSGARHQLVPECGSS
jgi:hypothetical protein